MLTDKQLKEEVLIVLSMYQKNLDWKAYLKQHTQREEIYKELQKVLDGGKDG